MVKLQFAELKSSQTKADVVSYNVDDGPPHQQLDIGIRTGWTHEEGFFERLRPAKGKSFREYIIHVFRELPKEVDSLFITVFYLPMYALMLLAGLQHQFDKNCPADPLFAMTTIQVSTVGLCAYGISLLSFIVKEKYSYLRRGYKIFHLLLFILNIIGLVHLYSMWKPNFTSPSEENFCQFDLYWTSFFSIHCSCCLYLYAVMLFLSSMVCYLIGRLISVNKTCLQTETINI